MATRLGSAGRGCIGVSAGVSSSIVRGLRSIRATVSTRDIVFGNGIPLLSPCHADPLQNERRRYAVLSQYDNPVKPPIPRLRFTTELFPRRNAYGLTCDWISRLAASGPTTKSHKRSNRTKRAGPRELIALVTAAVAACTGCHGHLFLSLSVGDQDFSC